MIIRHTKKHIRIFIMCSIQPKQSQMKKAMSYKKQSTQDSGRLVKKDVVDRAT